MAMYLMRVLTQIHTGLLRKTRIVDLHFGGVDQQHDENKPNGKQKVHGHTDAHEGGDRLHLVLFTRLIAEPGLVGTALLY